MTRSSSALPILLAFAERAEAEAAAATAPSLPARVGALTFREDATMRIVEAGERGSAASALGREGGRGGSGVEKAMKG